MQDREFPLCLNLFYWAIESHFLSMVMKAYLSNFPEVYPNIYSGPASLLFDTLVKGEVEFGLFFHIPELPEKLEIFETKEIQYHLVIRKDLRRDKNTIGTFIGSREIDDVSTKRFPTLERLRKDYPHAKIKISSNNLTAHKELVLQGLGVSVLPDFLISDDLKKGRLTDLYPNESFKFKMKFIKRKTTILTRNSQEFIKLCLKP